MWALVLGRGGFEPPKALGQLIYSQSRLTASVSARPRDFTDNRAMGTRRWILWQGLIAPSMERCLVGTSGAGFELSGLILQAHNEAPYVLRYRVELDAGWRTRNVEVELEDGGERRLSLTADGEGSWSRDGQRLEQVAGLRKSLASRYRKYRPPDTSHHATRARASATTGLVRNSRRAVNAKAARTMAPSTPPLASAQALVVPSFFSISVRVAGRTAGN